MRGIAPFNPIRIWEGPLTTSAREKVIRFLPAVAYLAFIYAFSAIPGERIPAVIDDRIAHTVEYFLLAILCMVAAAGLADPRVGRRHFLGTFAFTVLYAASDEIHQSFVPRRSPSLKDFGFDALGAAMGLAFIAILVRRRS